MPSIVVAKQGRRKGRKERHASLDKFRAKFGKRLGEPVIPYTKDVHGESVPRFAIPARTGFMAM